MPDYPVFQSIMDRAYQKWPAGGNLYPHLSPREKMAVALGNLNYQVENGGWYQWVTNGYFGIESVEALQKILNLIGTPEARTVYGLIDKFIVDYSSVHIDGNWEIDTDALPNDDELDEEFDKPYYEVNSELMAQAENYFKSQKTVCLDLTVKIEITIPTTMNTEELVINHLQGKQVALELPEGVHLDSSVIENIG